MSVLIVASLSVVAYLVQSNKKCYKARVDSGMSRIQALFETI